MRLRISSEGLEYWTDTSVIVVNVASHAVISGSPTPVGSGARSDVALIRSLAWFLCWVISLEQL